MDVSDFVQMLASLNSSGVKISEVFVDADLYLDLCEEGAWTSQPPCPVTVNEDVTNVYPASMDKESLQ